MAKVYSPSTDFSNFKTIGHSITLKPMRNTSYVSKTPKPSNYIQEIIQNIDIVIKKKTIYWNSLTQEEKENLQTIADRGFMNAIRYLQRSGFKQVLTSYYKNSQYSNSVYGGVSG